MAMAVDSKTTRTGLMEAVIMSKLEGICIDAPPVFLPGHITSESALREEGRNAEAGYGSRAKRGEALLQRALAGAEAAAARGEKRAAQKQSKVAAAEVTEGGKVFEVGADGAKIERALAPGERLKPRHLRDMGEFLGEWLNGIRTNLKCLAWTAKNIENQLVLINTENPKSRALVKACKQSLGLKDAKGTPIIANADSRIPETTGNRAAKVTRLLAFVEAEATIPDQDHGDASEAWELAVEKDPVAGRQVEPGLPRRPGSKTGSEQRASQEQSQTDEGREGDDTGAQICAGLKAAQEADRVVLREVEMSTGGEQGSDGDLLFSESPGGGVLVGGAGGSSRGGCVGEKSGAPARSSSREVRRKTNPNIAERSAQAQCADVTPQRDHADTSAASAARTAPAARGRAPATTAQEPALRRARSTRRGRGGGPASAPKL